MLLNDGIDISELTKLNQSETKPKANALHVRRNMFTGRKRSGKILDWPGSYASPIKSVLDAGGSIDELI
ncbi:hypothetical protein LZ023_37930 (plasmid) [Pseudomonas silvicola]|nr:hypothetical protein LZ023_37930 [Pseudomonas silvicola]